MTREDDGVWNDKESRCILWNPSVYDGLSRNSILCQINPVKWLHVLFL